MAKFSIKDPTNKDNPYYIDIGSGSEHTATTWEVAKDPNFIEMIDRVEKSTQHLTEWETPLPKLVSDKLDPEAEEFYSDLTKLYVRVQIHCGDAVSNTITIGPLNQTDQEVVVTEGGEVIEYTDSKKLNWFKNK